MNQKSIFSDILLTCSVNIGSTHFTFSFMNHSGLRQCFLQTVRESDLSGWPHSCSLPGCPWLVGSHHFTHEEQLRWSLAVFVYPDRTREPGSRSTSGLSSFLRMWPTRQRAASSMFAFSWGKEITRLLIHFTRSRRGKALRSVRNTPGQTCPQEM